MWSYPLICFSYTFVVEDLTLSFNLSGVMATMIIRRLLSVATYIWFFVNISFTLKDFKCRIP